LSRPNADRIICRMKDERAVGAPWVAQPSATPVEGRAGPALCFSPGRINIKGSV
jgi:hypothetical protein